MLEFWYEFASSYSYPAAMRIGPLAAAAGVAVRWRPFLLGPIFGAQGWNDFSVQSLSGQGALYVARPGAHLRQGGPAADIAARALSPRTG